MAEVIVIIYWQVNNKIFNQQINYKIVDKLID